VGGAGTRPGISDQELGEAWSQLWQTWPIRDQELASQRAWYELLRRWPGREAEILGRGLAHAKAYRIAGTPPSKVPALASWCDRDRWRDDPAEVAKRAGSRDGAAQLDAGDGLRSLSGPISAEAQQAISKRQAEEAEAKTTTERERLEYLERRGHKRTLAERQELAAIERRAALLSQRRAGESDSEHHRSFT
jgi:hypothetical protein